MLWLKGLQSTFQDEALKSSSLLRIAAGPCVLGIASDKMRLMFEREVATCSTSETGNTRGGFPFGG